MYPVKFEDSNRNLAPPSDWDEGKHGECAYLPVQTEDGVCKSCWQLSFWEVIRLMFKRQIFLYVVSGETQPPVKLDLA